MGATTKMGINIKLSIEIDDVKDTHLLQALESLLKSVSQVTDDHETQHSDKADGRRRRPPSPRFPSLRGSAKWHAFHDALPKRAQDFILFVKERAPEPLTQTEAMKRLGLTSPKAMGGVTGSIRRWAEVDEIELPWRSEFLEGERVWFWTGLNNQAHQEFDR